MNDRPRRPEDEHDEIIEPIDFRPSTAEQWRAPSRLLRPWLLASVGGLALLALVAVFLVTARPVLLTFSPEAEAVDVSGGLTLPVGGRILMRRGQYQVTAQREGYHPIDESFDVVRGEENVFAFEFRPLPGLLEVFSEPMSGARVLVNDADVGVTPLAGLELEAGSYDIVIEAARYLPEQQVLEITGRGERQTLTATLEPAWAEISLSTEPAGAEITLADGSVIGSTPATFELLQGAHVLTAKLDGYKAWQQELEVLAGQDQPLDPVQLERADGLLMISSEPTAAAVTVDGNFQGRTPLEVQLAPGRSYQVDLFRPGYARVRREVRIVSGAEQRLAIDLPAELGDVRIDVEPADAILLLDGREQGRANQTLSLPAVAHAIEIRKEGYVPYRSSVTPRPGFPQEISLRLQTVEEARRASIKPVIRTAADQEMRLLRPGPFTMGASRREPGRRANEVLREVTLTRPFYLSTTEVTNSAFRKFAAGHDSGTWENHSLDDDAQPVVNISWQEAALFSNWLSERDGLPPAYLVRGNQIVGFDPQSTGYRLPTEAEWEWAARAREDGSQLRFPWGEAMPPPERFGNYADRAIANLLGRTIMGYTDGAIVSAPVGNYDANHQGLFDVGGNVAEWVNDFYAGSSEDLPSGVVDPLGPDGGEYHVIRGASWMHGTITELRLTFRDFGKDGRNDVGFRLARYLE